MEQTYKFCQSCDMPLRKDPKGGGTNADGSLSTMYCSLCYANGEFRWKDATATQMQEFVKGKLKEQGLPGFVAAFFTYRIPKLERWKRP